MRHVICGKLIDLYVGFNGTSFIVSKNDKCTTLSFTPTLIIPFVLVGLFGVSIWSLSYLVMLVYGYGHIIWVLPFKGNSKVMERYGVGFTKVRYGNIISRCELYTGKSAHTFIMPWVRVITNIDFLMGEDEWRSVSIDNFEPPHFHQPYVETHPFVNYLKDGTKQTTEVDCYIFKVTLKSKLSFLVPSVHPNNVFIKFSEPVGSGDDKITEICSVMLPHEIPIDVIKRLERTRDFK